MINPITLLVLVSACMVGAIIQSVTGFGFGIFVMTLFPYFMPSYVSAVTLSSSLSFTKIGRASCRERVLRLV